LPLTTSGLQSKEVDEVKKKRISEEANDVHKQIILYSAKINNDSTAECYLEPTWGPQLRTEGFCWNNVLLPASPC